MSYSNFSLAELFRKGDAVELASPLRELVAFARPDADPPGVIAAVLQLPQSIDYNLCSILRTDISNDSADVPTLQAINMMNKINDSFLKEANLAEISIKLLNHNL
jgi:hypothetical protein